MSVDKIWMRPPKSEPGEAIEVEAKPQILTPLMVKGWSQCEPPTPQPTEQKETSNAS